VKLGDRDPMIVIRKAIRKEIWNGVGECEGSLVEMLRLAGDRAGKPIVLMLDQFEQFFVQFREEARGAFIGELKAWYESDVNAKILIGIRGDLSDRLVEIQKALGYAVRPSQVYRLEKFAPEQATAVLRVMAETEKWSFNEAFVLEMVRDELAGVDGKVAPVEVQVLAQMVSWEPSEDNRRFDKTSFQKLGGVDGLLGRSLQRSLQSLKGIMGKSSRDRALEVLLALTDLERNVRSGAFSIAQLHGMTEKVHGSPSDVESAIGWLAESRLVTPAEGDDAVRYELAHERLIPALRQVAKRELSDASRANLLLDRRVNEWLGSGKSGRYLFSLKELWLLRQQRGFLEWGMQRSQKEALVRRSWGRSKKRLGILSVPIAFGTMFSIWSHTPEGQVQWARWLLIEAFRYVESDQKDRSELFTALTLDSIHSVQAPLPMSQYFGWNAPTLSTMKVPMIKATLEISALSDKVKSAKLLKNMLSLSKINTDRRTQLSSMLAVSWAFGKLGETEQRSQILFQAPEITESMDRYDQITFLKWMSESYRDMGDTSKAKQLLSQALEITKSTDMRSANSLVSIAEGFGRLGNSEKGAQILSQALEINKSLESGTEKINSLLLIAEALAALGNREKSKQVLLQALKIIEFTEKIDNKSYFSSKDRRIEKSNYLVSAAKIFGKTGATKNGTEILSQAFKIIDLLKESGTSGSNSILDDLNDDKLKCLISIANAFRELGDEAKGRKILLDILRTNSSNTQREYIWSNYIPSIVGAFGKPNKTKPAKEFSLQESYIVGSLNSIHSRTPWSESISEAFDKLDASEDRKQLLFQMLEATKSMENSNNKLSILISLSKVSGILGDIEGGKKTLSQVTKIMNSIKNRDQEKAGNPTEELKLRIFEAYIELGETERGLQILSQAIKDANFVGDEVIKTTSLTEIAAASNELNNKDETKKVLSQLTEVAKSMKSESRKAFSLASIGNVYLQLGDRIQAKNILNDATKSLELSRNMKRDSSDIYVHTFTSALRKVANLHTELGSWGETLRLAQYLNGNDKILVLSRILQVHAEQKNPGLIIRKRSNRDEITYSEYEDGTINP